MYINITKGMYGLPQSGLLANKQLQWSLLKEGYFPCKDYTGIWKHQTRPIWFTLVVDDFGVKYVGREHAEHLLKSLRKCYSKVKVDWSGTLYCGLTLK